MRIRKHVRISAPSSISASPIVHDAPDTRVCSLNRSPWDVIPSCTNQHQQVKMEHNSVGRKSPNRSFGCMEQVEEEARFAVVDEKAKKKANVKIELDYIRCNKSDGKGWRCKSEAKQGEALCEHHLVQLEYYHHKYSCKSAGKSIQVKRPVVKKAAAAKKRVNRGKISPVDFYFYSGFGPSWGRKRSGNETKNEQLEVVDQASSSSSQGHVVHHTNDDHHNIAGHFEDDDDEDEDDDGGQKRIRKPIKARSLKSLL